MTFKKSLLENTDQINDIMAGDCNNLVDWCHNLAFEAGWWAGKDAFDITEGAAKIALMHSELSEGLEGLRKDCMDDHLPHRKMLDVELADAVIRIFDYAGARGIELGDILVEKLVYNATREDHKKENRDKPGGKKI